VGEATFKLLPDAFAPEFHEKLRALASTVEGKRGKVGYPYTERVTHAQRAVTARKMEHDIAADLIDPYNAKIREANDAVWQFDIDAELPLIMHLEYGPADHFVFHYDDALEDLQPHPRKLTAITMLSGPGEFDGGTLELKMFEQPITAIPLVHNMMIVFPSYTLHRVLPVTRGTRRTLVSWAHGPRWR
jgi:PKHD-type hydroxylase